MLRLFWTIFILLSLSPDSFGQSKIDSLKLVIDRVENDSLKVLTYSRLRQEYHRIDQNIALEYAIKAEELAKKAGLESSFAVAKYRKGAVLLNMTLYEQAEQEFNTALSIFSKLGDINNIAVVKVELARLLSRQSKIEDAFKLYLETLPLTKEIGDKNAEARIHNYLGELYKVQKQLDKAIEHYEMALSLVKELNFTPGISACLANLGSTYTEANNYAKAIPYLEEALKLKNATGDKLGASRVLSNLGNIFNDKQQYDLAENYFSQAFILAKEVDHPLHLSVVEFGLAQNAFYRQDFERCIEMANNIIAALASVQDLPLTIKTYKLLSNAYGEMREFDKAYLNAINHNQLSDSLYNEKILTVTNDLEAKYQNEQKAREIQLQALQILQGENERNFLIVFVAVILLLTGLVYNQYRIKYKANAKLKELDRLKSDFFANISHEFRTPLSLIMAPLKGKIDKSTSEKERNDYQIMYRNADRLLKLIDQLLDLSKLENRSIKLEKSPVDTNRFFKIIIASFSSLAEHKKIHFSGNLPEVNTFLEFDQDILQKVCNNLLSNAFKFTPEGGNINFIVNLHENKLVITVSDSGSGIPLEDQAKVFDRFFQSSTGNQSGTGIGLALTKELVEFHGGQITVGSIQNVGSKFTITIPVNSVEASEAKMNNIDSQNQSTSFLSEFKEEEGMLDGSPQILIIEDNPDLRNYLGQIIGEDYSIHLSENGAVGVSKAKEIIPDLIISDVMMPEKDGMEVCHELKEATETDHIPIILLTARADQESKLKGLTIGADDYLLKPFDPEELKARISNLLEQRSKLKEKYSQMLLLEPAEMEITSSEELFLKTVMEVVNKHLENSDFSAEQFCIEMGMSRMQLHRKLTALTGQSATAFVRHQRLVRASKLLEAGEPVSQVGYAVGFSSLSYFTKNFKQEFGISPSEYGPKVE